ncbi:MAG TPA: tRNA lysidine(34) synthetase TilS [Polyangiales bacterium]
MVVARVRRTIEQRALLGRGMRVLVGCSGGPDSAALLLALCRLAPELGVTLEAASVDHGLRADAALDVAVAARQARSLGVGFHALRVAVPAGGSVQAQAREARYEALLGLAAKLGAHRVAVGHTLDDQAETVLLRVLRGAGLRGLGAIEPLRSDGVIRPLLDCPRAEVHAFAQAHFVEIARDPSNDQSRWKRVQVRSQLMPALLTQDARVAEHLADLADEARASVELVDQLATELLQRARVDGETLRISELRKAPAVVLRAALRIWVLAQPASAPGRAQLAQLEQTIISGRGEVWLAQGARVVAAGAALAILRA